MNEAKKSGSNIFFLLTKQRERERGSDSEGAREREKEMEQCIIDTNAGCNRCTINTGIEKNELHLNID